MFLNGNRICAAGKDGKMEICAAGKGGEMEICAADGKAAEWRVL